jgi:hypothetical protein
MGQRLDGEAVAPEAMAAVLGVEAYIRGYGLQSGLIHPVKTRASQGWFGAPGAHHVISENASANLSVCGE